MKKIIIAIAVIAFLHAISWAICTGLIYLICLCFQWEFHALCATGIWLVVCLIKLALSTSGKKAE